MKYTKLLFLLVIALGIFACGGEKKADGHAKTHEMKTETVEAIYYTCPMDEHKHVGSKEPGTCNECGMDLVAAVKTEAGDHDFYGCPMAPHSHVRSDEPGTCDDCGMELKPLKLKS
jgi:hypothetical protein